MSDTASIEKLIEIMTCLRNPETGCPWDKVQTEKTIAKYTLEEAYETYDAIMNNDDESLKKELGDLLFHIVFYAQIQSEKGGFNFSDVAQAACDKMVARHPHIFTSATEIPDWETLKQNEREQNNETKVLSGIAKALPATVRAEKLQKRAARVGFDWDKADLVLDKIIEEANELRVEIHQESHVDEREDEMGDLLFACVNLARKLEIDAEKALKRTNKKFERRFNYIEESLSKQNRPWTDTNLDEMETLWVQAKKLEKTAKND